MENSGPWSLNSSVHGRVFGVGNGSNRRHRKFSLSERSGQALITVAVSCTYLTKTASSEASRQPVVGELFDSRVQGGIFADGLNGMLSGLFMNPVSQGTVSQFDIWLTPRSIQPVSIFAQNNGVISITRCANRFAGYFCAAFLILFGILSKISGGMSFFRLSFDTRC